MKDDVSREVVTHRASRVPAVKLRYWQSDIANFNIFAALALLND